MMLPGQTAASELRTIRNRMEAFAGAISRLDEAPPLITARRLVQVYDGGSIPTGDGPRVYLTHPCELDGAEVEGGAASVNADSSVSIPVVILGHAAVAGDVLVAYGVGGRWVSELGTRGGSRYPCGSCTIPMKDLTVSWKNPIVGDGSTALAYSGSPTTVWKSACTNELLYQLSCVQNQIEFRVTYFLSGSCPTGQSQYASTLRTAPYELTQTGLVCGPGFLLTASVTAASCPVLAAYGYVNFTVSV